MSVFKVVPLLIAHTADCFLSYDKDLLNLAATSAFACRPIVLTKGMAELKRFGIIMCDSCGPGHGPWRQHAPQLQGQHEQLQRPDMGASSGH
jgi:hypothetical protein